MSFFKLVLSFAPWLAFLIIAHGSLFRLKLGLVVALVLSVIMGLAKLNRGIILWCGLLFFVYATVAVVVLQDLWTVQYMGILANGALAASTWFTIAIGKPFTLDYARTHTDPSLWDNPLFIKANILIAQAWGATFLINTALAWCQMKHVAIPDDAYEILSYAFLLATAAFTSWYPAYARAKRLRAEAAPR